jgi:DNA polymerase I-like protein with 3'-5' exonuclease and polymerase domains
MHSSNTRKKVQEMIKNYHYIDYNLFGTITGRLTTHRSSFPVLTMRRELREILRPHNDLFISLDYNGAEIRTLLELSGQPQPQEDIHAWNARHLFEQEVTREECKVRFFAWLYDPTSDDIDTEHYNREKILDKWYKNGYIHTPYGREIHVEERKALNYLIQSTTADRVLAKAVIVDRLLKDRPSFISHIVHDEIVIDYHDEDRDLIPQIQEAFADGYLVNLKGGKDYYNLTELDI